MTTTVTYHGEYGRRAHPAINVKDRHSGQDFVIALERLVGDAAVALGESDETCRYPTDLRDIAYERVVARFWDEAQEVATACSLGTIYSEGRSGGWLVIDKDPTHGGEDDADPDWLAQYRTLAGWAEAYIASAPARTAALAQSLAMDAAGEGAAARMFAFVPVTA